MVDKLQAAAHTAVAERSLREKANAELDRESERRREAGSKLAAESERRGEATCAAIVMAQGCCELRVTADVVSRELMWAFFLMRGAVWAPCGGHRPSLHHPRPFWL